MLKLNYIILLKSSRQNFFMLVCMYLSISRLIETNILRLYARQDNLSILLEKDLFQLSFCECFCV